ncbi:hypothetical protein IWX92DRAFT_56551 [Phyllosticta citricarpa]
MPPYRSSTTPDQNSPTRNGHCATGTRFSKAPAWKVANWQTCSTRSAKLACRTSGNTKRLNVRTRRRKDRRSPTRAACSSSRLRAVKSAVASPRWRLSIATSYWSATTSFSPSGTASRRSVVPNGLSEILSSMASCHPSKSLGAIFLPLARMSSLLSRMLRPSSAASNPALGASRKISGKNTRRLSTNSKYVPNILTRLRRRFVPAASASCATKASTKSFRGSNLKTRCCAPSCRAARSTAIRRGIRWTRPRSWPRRNATHRARPALPIAIQSPLRFSATTRPRRIGTVNTSHQAPHRNRHPYNPRSSAGSTASKSWNVVSRRSVKLACSTAVARVSASRRVVKKTKSCATC